MFVSLTRQAFIIAAFACLLTCLTPHHTRAEIVPSDLVGKDNLFETLEEAETHFKDFLVAAFELRNGQDTFIPKLQTRIWVDEEYCEDDVKRNFQSRTYHYDIKTKFNISEENKKFSYTFSDLKHDDVEKFRLYTLQASFHKKNDSYKEFKLQLVPTDPFLKATLGLAPTVHVTVTRTPLSSDRSSSNAPFESGESSPFFYENKLIVGIPGMNTDAETAQSARKLDQQSTRRLHMARNHASFFKEPSEFPFSDGSDVRNEGASFGDILDGLTCHIAHIGKILRKCEEDQKRKEKATNPNTAWDIMRRNHDLYVSYMRKKIEELENID